MPFVPDTYSAPFRILSFGQPGPSNRARLDEATGYRLQAVAGCKVSVPFIAAVEAYNKAMQKHFDNAQAQPRPAH